MERLHMEVNETLRDVVQSQSIVESFGYLSSLPNHLIR